MDEWRLTFSSDDSSEFVNVNIYSPKYERESKCTSSTRIEVSSMLGMDAAESVFEFSIEESKDNDMVSGIEDNVCDYQMDNLDDKLLNESCVKKYSTNLVTCNVSRKPLSTLKSGKDEILLNDFVDQKLYINMKDLHITPEQSILSKEVNSLRNNMENDVNGTLQRYQEIKCSNILDNSLSTSIFKNDEISRTDSIDQQLNILIEDLCTTVEQFVLYKETKNSSRKDTEKNANKPNYENKHFNTLDKINGVKSKIFNNPQETSNSNTMYCPHCKKLITDIGKRNVSNSGDENRINLEENQMAKFKISSNTNKLLELSSIDNISKNILLALSSEELKRGASMTSILKYFIQNTNLKSTTKLKKDIRKFLNIAVDAHMLKRMRWNRYILTDEASLHEEENSKEHKSVNKSSNKRKILKANSSQKIISEKTKKIKLRDDIQKERSTTKNLYS